MNEIANQPIQAPLDVSEKSIFANVEKFEQVKYMAEYLSNSDMVPKEYQKKPANVLIALSMAERMRADPMMVMQNLVIIHGRPSWSSQFLIASVNNSGRFSPIKFEEAEGEIQEVKWDSWYNKQKTVKSETVKNDKCRAYATELSSDEIVYGPWISVEMAVKEGWYSKSGSKWKTLPQLMLQYRAAAFFVRTKAPEVSMGMHTEDEVRDMGKAEVIEAGEISGESDAQALLNELKGKKKPAAEVEPEEKPVEVEKEPVIEDDFDIVKFMKMSIDSCSTVEELKELGEDIKEKIDEGKLDNDQTKEIKLRINAALKAAKET